MQLIFVLEDYENMFYFSRKTILSAILYQPQVKKETWDYHASALRCNVTKKGMLLWRKAYKDLRN